MFTIPGWIANEAIPDFPAVWASSSERRIRAVLAIDDAKIGIAGARVPDALATLTIRPPLRAIIAGITTALNRKAPRTIDSMHSYQPSGSTSQSLPAGPGAPALFTRIETGPNCCETASTAAETDSGLRTSARVA